MIQPPRLATQLAIYPARDQYQLIPGASICKLELPLKITTLYLLIRPAVTVLIMAQYPKCVRWFSRNHMNLSSARVMASLKVPYSLTPFSQQRSARVAHPGPSLPIHALPSGRFFTVHRGVLLVVVKEV